MLLEVPKKIYIWSIISISLIMIYPVAVLIYGIITTGYIISLIISTTVVLGFFFAWLYPMFWLIKKYNNNHQRSKR